MKDKQLDNLLKEKIGINIKSLRNIHRKTIEELAQEADIGVQTLKQLEKGETDCYVSTLVAVSKALNVSLDYIVGNVEKESPENMMYLLNSLTKEKRVFAESLVYQIKTSPYEFILPKDDKEL